MIEIIFVFLVIQYLNLMRLKTSDETQYIFIDKMTERYLWRVSKQATQNIRMRNFVLPY